MRLKVMDIWHPSIKGSRVWVYSDNEVFDDMEDFLTWVMQHQSDLTGVVRA